MQTNLTARASRACRLAIKMLGLTSPRNIWRVWQVGRLRRGGRPEGRLAQATIEKYSDFTRRRFAAAKRRGEQTIYVVIPSYNEALHLPGTLVALARNPNVLPIVVNNRSSDQTPQVAQTMGATVIDQPTGSKMAATQRGIRYAKQQFKAQRILFLDGDTMPVTGWAEAMDKALRELDHGQGAAVFGNVINMFGASVLADIASTWLNFMYTILREIRGEAPIARGGNYGLSFDAQGVMEKQLNTLDQNLFYATDGKAAPDDTQTLLVVQKAGATTRAIYSGKTWTVTNNDRITSLKDVKAFLKRGASYNDVVSQSYAKEYGITATAPAKNE